MDKNDSITPQEKKDNNKQTVIIPLMAMAVLLIVELYVMTHMPGNYPALIIVTVLFLVSAYFLGNGILKEIQNNKMRAEEQYEAITKSGKASYILLKKAFEQLEEIEGNSKKPAEDIITAQKAIAKVTISRNKENTDALMNSNDKVLEKIFDFEENLGNNQNDLLDKQRDIINNSMKALMQQQEEIASNMRAMEESIKNELLQAMSSMQVAQPVQPQPVADLGLGDIEPIAHLDLGESEPALDFDLGESEPIADLDLGESEPTLDFDLGESEPALDFDLGESEPIADLDLGESEPALDFDLGESEPIADLDLGESEPALDFNLGESEPIADLDLGETGLDDSLGIGTDLNLGSDLNLGEDINLGTDLNLGEDINLGKDLNLGEDIDLGLSEDLNLGEPAIPADMNIGMELSADEEPVAEETIAEEVVEEPVVEESVSAAEEDTAMPDLSDPHKLMTPEEIAALIAKM